MDNLIVTSDIANPKIGIFLCAFRNKEVMQELILIQICKLHKTNRETLKYAPRKLIKLI